MGFLFFESRSVTAGVRHGAISFPKAARRQSLRGPTVRPLFLPRRPHPAPSLRTLSISRSCLPRISLRKSFTMECAAALVLAVLLTAAAADDGLTLEHVDKLVGPFIGRPPLSPCWEDATTHELRCLPRMFILGSPKSGTTDLTEVQCTCWCRNTAASWLGQHHTRAPRPYL